MVRNTIVIHNKPGCLQSNSFMQTLDSTLIFGSLNKLYYIWIPHKPWTVWHADLRR